MAARLMVPDWLILCGHVRITCHMWIICGISVGDFVCMVCLILFILCDMRYSFHMYIMPDI